MQTSAKAREGAKDKGAKDQKKQAPIQQFPQVGQQLNPGGILGGLQMGGGMLQMGNMQGQGQQKGFAWGFQKSKGKAKGHQNHDVNIATLQKQQLMEYMRFMMQYQQVLMYRSMMQQIAQLGGQQPPFLGIDLAKAGPVPGNVGQGAQLLQAQLGQQPQAAAIVGMRGGGYRQLLAMQQQMQLGGVPAAIPQQPVEKQKGKLPVKKK
jgi:hypothetical protein